jgi:hypothetical protein
MVSPPNEDGRCAAGDGSARSPTREKAAACATALSMGGGMLATTPAGSPLQLPNTDGNRRTHVSVTGSRIESATIVTRPVCDCTMAVAACRRYDTSSPPSRVCSLSG